jgi:hypothetical protein
MSSKLYVILLKSMYGVSMKDIKEDIEALKKALRVKKDTELTETLGISYSAIDAWKRRGKLPEKYKKYIHNVDGNNNMIAEADNAIMISGKGNMVSGSKNSYSQGSSYNDDIQEICELLQEYGSPKMIKDIKEKLLQIKALHG